jgi:DGQHR domain-containing protein
MPTATKPDLPIPASRGYLDFKAIRDEEVDRIVYIGAMPIFELIDRHFITPVASQGLTREILEKSKPTEPVQRRTNAAHVQAILDYIVEEAEAGRPWAFGAIVLYSTEELEYTPLAMGHQSVVEVRITHSFSVGEGLHRALAWAVALGVGKVRGVKRPQISTAAEARIMQATIPAMIVVESDLKRQKGDFHRLNQQKPLTSTVDTLTDDTVLSDLTKAVIHDVAIFEDRIDLNNASVGVKSDKLLSFAQLRFVVASYLLGRATRNKKAVEEGVEQIAKEEGKQDVRTELAEVFTEVVTKLGPLGQLQQKKVPPNDVGDFVRQVRQETLLASNAAWRALFVALHEAQAEGVAPKTAIRRVAKDPKIWSRKGRFFVGSLIDRETKKLLSNRESIDAASDRLRDLMLGE